MYMICGFKCIFLKILQLRSGFLLDGHISTISAHITFKELTQGNSLPFSCYDNHIHSHVDALVKPENTG